MQTLERWLAVPFIFGLLFYAAVTLRWLSASLERAKLVGGHGEVFGFHLMLVWYTAQRATVVFVLTIAALPFVAPLRRAQVFYIASAAVAAEFVAEWFILVSTGGEASRVIQLTATGTAYLVTLVVVVLVMRLLERRRSAAV